MTTLSPTIEFHEATDAMIALMKSRPVESNFNNPCESCLSAACCSESVMAASDEADLILSRMTPDEIEDLKPRVLAWIAKAKPLLSHPHDGIGIPWRLSNNPCPLLVNGRCSVYESRPESCRTFFAHSHPERCDMPARIHQKFACLDHNGMWQMIALKYLKLTGKIFSDHLGLLLYNRLFGTDETSAAASLVELVGDEEAVA